MKSNTFKNCIYVRNVPEILIDLSVPPTQRWSLVIEQYKQFTNINVQDLVFEVKEYVDSYLSVCSFINITSKTNSILGKLLRFLTFIIIGIFCRFSTYSEDISAISSILHISSGELFLMNVFYEIFGGCTSFICQDKTHRSHSPMLGRTLDWPFPNLAKHTVHFTWVNHVNGEKRILFRSVGWLGYVGVMTGVKSKKFAISLNARYLDDTPVESIKLFLSRYLSYDDEMVDSLALILSVVGKRLNSALSFNSWTSGNIIRKVLEQTNTYEEAVRLLSEAPLLAPSYFIVAGANIGEGCVLSRDLNPSKDLNIIDDKNTNNPCRKEENIKIRNTNNLYRSLKRSSYLVQTNVDVPCDSDCADRSPADFNSIARLESVQKRIQGFKNGALSPYDAALILSTPLEEEDFFKRKKSRRDKNVSFGVRMKMTIHFTVMRPHDDDDDCLISAVPTEFIGPG